MSRFAGIVVFFVVSVLFGYIIQQLAVIVADGYYDFAD